MARDIDTWKFILRYLFSFVRGAISWQYKLYKRVALSTTETEYIASREQGVFMDKEFSKRIVIELRNICYLLWQPKYHPLK